MKLHPFVTNKKTKTRFKKLIVEFEEKYGDKLDFTDSEYLGLFKNIKYWCNVHNESFDGLPVNLLRKSCIGCPICAQAARVVSRIARSRLTFVKRVSEGSNGAYVVSSADYMGNTVKVEAWCNIHKHSFFATPSSLYKGAGCKDCGQMKKSIPQTIKPRAEFKEKAELKHPDKFLYHLVNYINGRTPVEIWCIACNCSFWITPKHLLKGSAHSGCAITGFNRESPATLYYFRVDTPVGTAWKIGITNRSVKERLSPHDFSNITILSEEYFELGQYAYDKEQEILKKFKESKYTGDDLLDSGNTELFYKDVLELDKSTT